MPIKMSNYNYAGYEAVSQEVGMGGYYGYMCVFKKAKSAKTSRLCGEKGGGGQDHAEVVAHRKARVQNRISSQQHKPEKIDEGADRKKERKKEGKASKQGKTDQMNWSRTPARLASYRSLRDPAGNATDATDL